MADTMKTLPPEERTSVAPTPTAMVEVYDVVDGELGYQDHIFADLPRGAGDRSLDEFILYLGQYIDEARTLSTHCDEVAALHHVRKVAALAVRCMSVHGAPRREGF